MSVEVRKPDRTFNLIDYHIREGDVIISPSGCIVERKWASPDLACEAAVLVNPKAGGIECVHFNYTRGDIFRKYI